MDVSLAFVDCQGSVGVSGEPMTTFACAITINPPLDVPSFNPNSAGASACYANGSGALSSQPLEVHVCILRTHTVVHVPVVVPGTWSRH